MKNKLISERESRKQKEQQLRSLINQNMEELERYQSEYQSLIKVTQSQQNLLQKLQNIQ